MGSVPLVKKGFDGLQAEYSALDGITTFIHRDEVYHDPRGVR